MNLGNILVRQQQKIFLYWILYCVKNKISNDSILYCFQCFPQSKQEMKIVDGSSADRVCNS